MALVWPQGSNEEVSARFATFFMWPFGYRLPLIQSTCDGSTSAFELLAPCTTRRSTSCSQLFILVGSFSSLIIFFLTLSLLLAQLHTPVALHACRAVLIFLMYRLVRPENPTNRQQREKHPRRGSLIIRRSSPKSFRRSTARSDRTARCKAPGGRSDG